MTNPVFAFERRVLRPMFVALVALALVSGFQTRWWWLGGAVVSLFYLGTIGAGLHPLQSAADLSHGPIEGEAAIAEAVCLDQGFKIALVGRACTSVALLVGSYAMAASSGGLGLRWFWCVAIAFFVFAVFGGFLKVAFGAP